jgi:hypothetical protein
MPLNRTWGEHVEGLGQDYKLASLSKWTDTRYWDSACERAAQQFERAGATMLPKFDEQHILVQEYHNLKKPLVDKETGTLFFDAVVFLFNYSTPISVFKRDDPGQVKKDLIARVVIGLTPAQKAELVMAGRWRDKVAH